MYPGSYNPGLEVYNPRVRPNQGQGPVRVTANLYLRAVEDIDVEKNVSKTMFEGWSWFDNGQKSVSFCGITEAESRNPGHTFLANSVDIL